MQIPKGITTDHPAAENNITVTTISVREISTRKGWYEHRDEFLLDKRIIKPWNADCSARVTFKGRSISEDWDHHEAHSRIAFLGSGRKDGIVSYYNTTTWSTTWLMNCFQYLLTRLVSWSHPARLERRSNRWSPSFRRSWIAWESEPIFGRP